MCAGARKDLVGVTARARASLASALRRQSDGTKNQQQPQPRLAYGARDRAALHRMHERVLIRRRQGHALRALRGLDGIGSGDAH